MKKLSTWLLSLCLLAALAACAGPENPDVDDDPIEDTPDDVVIGGDWRVWRSYSDEFAINEHVTILLSSLDTGSGMAVYDNESGARIGNLIFANGGDYFYDDAVRPWDPILLDLDDDGSAELGFEMTDGVIVWYRYAEDAEAWPDNINGVFAYVRSDTPDHPITASTAEEAALIAALGSKLDGKHFMDQGVEKINGEDCRMFAIGTDTPEKFTAEAHYAVSPTGDIYYMDVLQGAEWLPYLP